MKIGLLSDLHLNHSTFVPPSIGCDVVILAGDIERSVRAIAWSRSVFSCPVIQVAGNHEHYRTGSVRENIDSMRREAKGSNVRFLENESVVIEGVRFLGCTLWTDFALYGTPAKSMEIGAGSLNDFVLCRWIDSRGKERTFLPRDSVAMHLESRQWLERELAEPADGWSRTVVVTHHLPSRKCIHPIYDASPVNPCFVSNLDYLMQGVDVWVHGHTHSAVRETVGGCRILCNPRGYSDRPETPDAAFDPAFVFEV
jgi:predicted phosphodiesterase